MALVIQKYGGTSVADENARKQVVDRVRAAHNAQDRLVLVVSAMGRKGDPYATDSLLELLDEYDQNKIQHSLTADLLSSCGEIITACVMSSLLVSNGIPAKPLTAFTADIHAEGPFGDATPIIVTTERLERILERGVIPIVAGFQGVDSYNNIQTLGRGGSDTSAVAIGAALKADFVDIYKDVPGVAKADPRLVPDAPFMRCLDYSSMFRLASHGARVLHNRSALLAQNAGIRMRIRATCGQEGYTLIGTKEECQPDLFLGLATSATPQNTLLGILQAVAVFSQDARAADIEAAQAIVDTFALTRVPLYDAQAVGFSCPTSMAAPVAHAFFERFPASM